MQFCYVIFIINIIKLYPVIFKIILTKHTPIIYTHYYTITLKNNN